MTIIISVLLSDQYHYVHLINLTIKFNIGQRNSSYSFTIQFIFHKVH